MHHTDLFEFASNVLDAVIWIGFVVIMAGL
jgi:hypothetical protein